MRAKEISSPVHQSIPVSGKALEFLDCGIRLLGCRSLEALTERELALLSGAIDAIRPRREGQGNTPLRSHLAELRGAGALSSALRRRRKRPSARDLALVDHELRLANVMDYSFSTAKRELVLLGARTGIPLDELQRLVLTLSRAYRRVCLSTGKQPWRILRANLPVHGDSLATTRFHQALITCRLPDQLPQVILSSALSLVGDNQGRSTLEYILASEIASSMAVLAHLVWQYHKTSIDCLVGCWPDLKEANPKDTIRSLYQSAYDKAGPAFATIYRHRLPRMFAVCRPDAGL